MQTPFYVYDLDRLNETINKAKIAANRYGYHIHYALKANYDLKVNRLLASHNIGADCVSGNEILHAIKCDFNPQKIVFAGVGKTDEEINTALRSGIACFNIESDQEILVINELAKKKAIKAKIAIRVNPNVSADTHRHITTGMNENKFGIHHHFLMDSIEKIEELSNVELVGLHFHIGSQILNMDNFKTLCLQINNILEWIRCEGIFIEHINLGGGLGINYNNPEEIPNFESFFKTYHRNLNLDSHMQIHFELGRSLVGQCGELWSKVLYIKEGINKKFAIIDAGMTHLMRPALYDAYHKISLHNNGENRNSYIYEVVGPICESTDILGKERKLPELHRGDILITHSAGAYGEVMSNNYNMKPMGDVMYRNRAASNTNQKENNALESITNLA